MWTCRACGEVFVDSETDPAIRHSGEFYFTCPNCGGNNDLVNTSPPGEVAILVQLNDV